MLDSVFIAIFIVSLIIQIIAVYEKSVIFSILSIMFWFILMVNAIYIEVPYSVAYATNGSVNITTGAHTYCEYGLAILFLAFVFFDIVWALIQYMDFKKQGDMP